VLLAFMVANGFATAAWTSAYPTFAELFPTDLQAAGVGTSVAVGRLGAAYGTLYLPNVATKLGPTASYLLIIGFWAIGVAAIIIWSLTGGVAAAGKPLSEVDTVPPADPVPVAAVGPATA
jgi:nitrate/nitrite transporter NarK